jgi:hypothetical protein
MIVPISKDAKNKAGQDPEMLRPADHFVSPEGFGNA